MTSTTAICRGAVVLLPLVTLAACAPPVRQIEADVIEADPAPTARQPSLPRYTEADVRFMQHMIAHHRQAVEMTGLVAARSASDDVRRMAQRIEASQEDELRQMERWLQARGEALPAAHAHHGHGAAGRPAMPGMLTDAQLAELAVARGEAFDSLFLELMIFHHEGALVMVEELFATPGAGQDTEIFQFASHVDSDQRIEIDRMRRLLSTLQRGR
jgi:uncharacterized protein (DUF305 family)